MKNCKRCKFWSSYGDEWGSCDKLTKLDPEYNGKFVIYAEMTKDGHRQLIDIRQVFLDTREDFGCVLAE